MHPCLLHVDGCFLLDICYTQRRNHIASEKHGWNALRSSWSLWKATKWRRWKRVCQTNHQIRDLIAYLLENSIVGTFVQAASMQCVTNITTGRLMHIPLDITSKARQRDQYGVTEHALRRVNATSDYSGTKVLVSYQFRNKMVNFLYVKQYFLFDQISHWLLFYWVIAPKPLHFKYKI